MYIYLESLFFGTKTSPKKKKKTVQLLDYRVGGNDHRVHQAFPIQGVPLIVQNEVVITFKPKISR